MKRNRILEIGVQSGGFAVPVILAAHHGREFSYTGVDNREYTNAVPLQLISDYLRLHDVSQGIRLIEGDSTAVIRASPPSSFDLILMDHYKPKYSYDLLHLFERDLLSDDGAVVLHDVLTHARRQWRVCERLCSAFGYSARVDPDVVQGAGIIQRRDALASRQPRAMLARLDVSMSWSIHAFVLRSRRAVGRRLRAMGR
jgi:predicted O-methyltransferase YrrM